MVTIVATGVPGTARRISTTFAASPACAGTTALPGDAREVRAEHGAARDAAVRPRGLQEVAQARAWQTEPSSWQTTASASKRQST